MISTLSYRSVSRAQESPTWRLTYRSMKTVATSARRSLTSLSRLAAALAAVLRAAGSLPEGDIAKGFLRLPTGRGEVDRRVGAKGQLARQSAGSIAERPGLRARRRLHDQIEAGNLPVRDFAALFRNRLFFDQKIGEHVTRGLQG